MYFLKFVLLLTTLRTCTFTLLSEDKYNCPDCNCDIPYDNSHFCRESSNCIYFPGNFGSFRKVNLKRDKVTQSALDQLNIKYYYQTHGTTGIIENTENSIAEFKLKNEWLFVLGKQLQSVLHVCISHSEYCVDVAKELYEKIGDNIGKLSFMLTPLVNEVFPYSNTVETVDYTGRMIGDFIKSFKERLGIRVMIIHIVGLGEDAHVGTMVSRRLQGVNNIIALDPMGPIWYNEKSKLLNEKDAECVINIVTDAFKLGLPDPLGRTNIYFSKGKHPQPGCITSVCSHLRAMDYFKVLMNDEVEMKQCENYKQALNGTCKGEKQNFTLVDFEMCPRGVFAASVNTKKLLHTLKYKTPTEELI